MKNFSVIFIKWFLLFFLFNLMNISNGQNIQYQLNNNSNHIITFEHLKIQKQGKFFCFSDFTITNKGNINSYVEIFQYWRNFTIQYNFGLNENFIISPVYLIGFSQDFLLLKFNCNIDLLYRYSYQINEKISLNNSYQLSLSYFKESDKLLINGFIDYWDINQIIINTNIWYKLNKDFQIGCKGFLGNYLNNTLSIGFKYNL